jgi:hypothetical protein
LQTYTTPAGNGPTTGADQGATDQAKEKAQQAAGAAKEQAQQAAGQAKGALRSQVDQRSTMAGEKVGGFASDVRSVGEQLRQQGKDQPAKIADQAAERAERIGGYLKDSDADRILGDIEDFGRRQPWAVVAGGLMLGLAASRFLKASSSRRYEERRSQQTYGQLPARTTSGIHTSPVSTGPAVPTTPPADTTVTGGMPAGSPGATAPGPSRFEGV